MAILSSSARDTGLLYPSDVTIGDLTTGAHAGEGFFIGFGFRMGTLPSGTAQYEILGRSADTTAPWNTSGDTGVRIGGSGAVVVGSTSRISAGSRVGTTDLWAGGQTTAGYEGAVTATEMASAMVAGTNYFIVFGVTNLGTVGSPDWRGFIRVREVGGSTVFSRVAATAAPAGYITGTKQVLNRLFAIDGGTPRSPADIAIEHVGVVRGEITTTQVGQLADGTETYQTLESAAGWEVLDYRRLSNTTDRSRIYGTSGIGDLTLSQIASPTGNITDAAAILSGAWGGSANITIVTSWAVPGEIVGGRGTYAISVSGTSAGVTGVERRWVNASTGAPLAGGLGTWTAATFDSGTGNWSLSDTLPWSGAACTEYRLELRNPAATVTASQAGLWVGTHGLTVGQSGMKLLWGDEGDGGLGTNHSSLAVVAGAVGQLVTVSNQFAESGGAYVRPVVQRGLMLGGTTPAVNPGSIAFLNEWHAAGGGPLRLTIGAISGTGAAETIANATVAVGARVGNWTFLGTKGLPGPSSAGTVGFHGMLAFEGRSLLDFYLLMWMPGIGGTVAEAEANIPGLWTALDGLWNVKPTLKLVAPPYRIARQVFDSAHDLFRREEVYQWAVANDAILGAGTADAYLIPQVSDIFMGDPTNKLHPSSKTTEVDANGGSVRRAAASYGRAAVAAFGDGSGERFGPVASAAWLEAGGAQMVIEFGKRLTTLAGATPSPRSFFVSTDNGATWTRGLSVGSPFTAAIEGTRVRLTRASGTWSATNLRVAVLREFWPTEGDGVEAGFTGEPAYSDSEAHQRTALNGMIYQVAGAGWRFGAAGALPGWPICPTDYNGIPVSASKPSPALVMTHPLPAGAKTVQVRAFGTGLPPGGELITLANPAVVL